MTKEEISRKLQMLPWQAVYELALSKQIDREEIQKKEKNEIISKLLLQQLTDEEVNVVLDDYIYGNRVTFTLWGFSKTLSEDDFSMLKALEGTEEGWIDPPGFRNLKYISVKDCQDRFEILYSYSKEYAYMSEEGRTESIWEMHRGCLWVGKEKNYLASISKHEKMMQCVVQLLGQKLDNKIRQIKPPKKAIERCTNFRAMSRIVLQGMGGEKTTISNSTGFTEEQNEEMARIRDERFDTSGSYIAVIGEDTDATVKYNFKKGNLGIYKHLSSATLFAWSKNAIEIIFEEIENLKGKPAKEIFKEMGVEIKWNGYGGDPAPLNWLLTQVIASMEKEEEYCIQMPDEVKCLLTSEKLFLKLPRVFCNTCDAYEIPYCANCGEPLTYNRRGELECGCDAPLKITCVEHHRHSCEIIPWYLPKAWLTNKINTNIQNIYKNHKLEYTMCIMGDALHIVHHNKEADKQVEIPFDEISCFQSDITPDPSVRAFAVRMNEKCRGNRCSHEKVDQCIRDATIICLPKIFYGIVPGYRLQPHKGAEFGDISGQIQVGDKYYEMIGIIKKNSENKSGGRSKARTDDKLITTPLLATDKEGEEIIRQFVEQGMANAKVDAIAVIAPQYFDHSLKGTLHMLAKLSGKKVIFIGLDELCQVLAMNEKNIKIQTN